MEDLNALISKCKKGDSRAQSILFDLYKKKWLGVCVRYIKDDDDAKDIFQEAAIKIFTDLKELKQPDAFAGWTRRIMINQSLNHLKKRKNYSLVLQDYSEVAVKEDEVDFDAVRRMDSTEILFFINQLPEGYRVVLNLSVIDGYKHSEIAKILSITESTSRSQLNKARKFLQRLFEEQKIKDNERIAG